MKFENKLDNNNPEKIKELVEKFKEARDNFSDVIPEEMKYSTSPDSGYKVQAIWWSGLNAIITQLEMSGAVDKQIIDEGDIILNKSSDHRKETGLTSAEDIKAANEYIEKVIKLLEAKTS